MRLSKPIATSFLDSFKCFWKTFLEVDESGIYTASGCGSVPWSCLNWAGRYRAQRITIVTCCSFECWQLAQRKMSSSLRKLWRLQIWFCTSGVDWRLGRRRELCNRCLWQMNLCYRRDLKEEELVCCISNKKVDLAQDFNQNFMYSTQDSLAWNTYSFTAYGREVDNTKSLSWALAGSNFII